MPADRKIFPPDRAARWIGRTGEPYRPSNGSEGELFEEAWCARCIQDVDFRADPDHAVGCMIWTWAMAFRVDDPGYPIALRYGADGQPECTMFAEHFPGTPDAPAPRCGRTLDLFAPADRISD